MTRSFATLMLAALLPACGGSGTIPGAPTAQNATGRRAPAVRSGNGQSVYWSLDGDSGVSQIQFADDPLRKNSRVTTIDSNSNNQLVFSSGMHFDAQGRLWIITFGPYGGDPASVYIFDVPLTKKSQPRYEFVLQGTASLNQLAFDASGDLWVTEDAEYGANAVVEYTGPFNRSGTLTPAVTLTDGIQGALGLAFDKTGNLYVSNLHADTNHSIAVFAAPASNRPPYFLNGLHQPGGLIFDAAGNLYGSDNFSSFSAIVRYNSNNLKAGARPDIVDRTSLTEIAERNFALTSSGDLYFTNCGVHPSVYRYATSRKPFTAKLAPSIDYTNNQIRAVGCVWGIAIE
ncbi:MAG TPA: hypothetical protein VIW73_01700 [Candidatus Cybelea sp.]